MTKFVIDYFELPAREAAPSGAFFAQAFGWSLQPYGPGYLELREAGVLGGVNAHTSDQARAPVIGIRTDDIATAERAVLRAGGTITRAAYEYPGGRRFFFREPGGNELMVYQPGE
jgi:uncharacterized protein